MQHIQYLKPGGPLMRTESPALSGFLCLGRQFFPFSVIKGVLLFFVCVCARDFVSVPSFLCDEGKRGASAGWAGRRAGGNGAFDFLFTLGAIETQRCKRICDIESVLITKTGIKGD